jgi:hypothetical protein
LAVLVRAQSRAPSRYHTFCFGEYLEGLEKSRNFQTRNSWGDANNKLLPIGILRRPDRTLTAVPQVRFVGSKQNAMLIQSS